VAGVAIESNVAQKNAQADTIQGRLRLGKRAADERLFWKAER
jgi:hypothetical protein